MFADRAFIAILGPATTTHPQASELADLASDLGVQLSKLGYGVLVHGQGLTAQAAAKGARTLGGMVLAVGTEAPPSVSGKDMKPVDLPGVETALRPTAMQALEHVVELASAHILLPGDLHSLSLLLQTWSWGLEPEAPFRQTILLGESWPETVRTLADAVKLDAKTRAMVTFAKTAAEAVESLRYYVAPKREVAATV